jgi:hypothetical protein
MVRNGLRALGLCLCMALAGCGIPDGIAYAVKSVNPPKKETGEPVPASYRPAAQPAAQQQAPAAIQEPPPNTAPPARGPIRAEALPPP